jgi:CDP-glycerol glycerophosphotransferase
MLKGEGMGPVTTPRISVVVPFYNNEELLAECLESIAAQTHRDLEVIMVDDGSTDGGAKIARAMADADPRFTLVSVANGGPGYARNRGVERARGEFLAFVDGDDMLPANAYELLLDTLERSSSDFACGNVSRIGPGGIYQSGLHARAIKGRQTGTHITATPRLLYDISVFNKLFRKSFWDAHQLSFPEGMLWEDLQLMTKAHVLARAVEVIPQCVYYWRERGKGQLSITQSRTNIGNLRDRIAALLAIDGFLAVNAPPKLLRKHQDKALRNDLWLYVTDLHKTSDAYRAEFIDLAGKYLDQVRPRVLRGLPAPHKLAYHLIRLRALPQLMEFVTWYAEQPVRTLPVVRRWGRLVADLPMREGSSVPLPRQVFRPHWRELDPFVRVNDISWRGDRLVITGLAYVPSIDIVKRRHATKILVLRPRGRGLPLVVPARSVRDPEATVLSGQDRYNYEWGGFRCEISPRLFRLGGRWMTGEWEAYILVRGHGVWRPSRVHTPRPGRAERPGLRPLAPGLRFGARWEGRRLHVGVWQVAAVAAGHRLRGGGMADGTVEIDVALSGVPGRGLRAGQPSELPESPRPAGAAGAREHADGAGAPGVSGTCGTSEAPEAPQAPEAPRTSGAELVLVRQGGAAAVTFPAAVVTADRDRTLLRADIPVRSLAAHAADRGTGGAGNAEGAKGPEPEPGDESPADAGRAAAWDVYIARPGLPRARVAFATGDAEVAEHAEGTKSGGPGDGAERQEDAEGSEGRYLLGGRELVIGRSSGGGLEIALRPPHPVLTEHAWLHPPSGGRLLLRGTLLGASGALEAVLRRRGSGDQHVIPARAEGERFTIEADVGAMPLFGEALPLRDGVWDIFVRHEGRGGQVPPMVRVKYDHARLADIPEQQVEIGPKLYGLRTVGYDEPVISVQPRLRPSEQGQFNQRVLRRAYYPLKLRAPMRDAIVFVSWKGKQCADNPRAIADELRRRGDDREHIWIVQDWSAAVPEGSSPVLYGTEEYYDALARARYLIGNDDMQPPYRKRDGQFYLQTWHGTPLKRIGFDIERPQFISGAAYFDRLADDVAKWDLLISPNPFSTPIMRRAFRYEGEICESGYPRNDLLRRGDSAGVAARVRRRLGLPEGKRVVLYAPTWRDNQVYASGRRYRFDLRLDLERARQALGRDHVLLLRGHHHMADDVPPGAGGFVINVTAYPDISELYLVSDLLVTDYSSAMFDYAATGRPMLFFTYDLAEYRDSLRGFYFDFEAEAPGPLIATPDEVLAAIRDIDAVAARHAAAYQAFTAKFCPYDDGKAAARVCDRVFGS